MHIIVHGGKELWLLMGFGATAFKSSKTSAVLSTLALPSQHKCQS